MLSLEHSVKTSVMDVHMLQKGNLQHMSLLVNLQGSDFASVLSTGENAPQVLCSDLGTAVYE